MFTKPRLIPEKAEASPPWLGSISWGDLRVGAQLNNFSEEINPLWHLADPLTVLQAAALIAGCEPNSVSIDLPAKKLWFKSEHGHTSSDGITWVYTALNALINAVEGRNLKAMLRYDAEPRYTAGIDNLKERNYWNGEDAIEIKGDWPNDEETYVISREPNWTRTTIAVADLRAWLEKGGNRTGFFFPNATITPDFLDQNNPRYAPKLAAAVRAWQAVTDTGGKSPKQALTKWLREHASEFGLSDDDGKPNETGIEEIAKVTNWQTGGGAPKTPSG